MATKWNYLIKSFAMIDYTEKMQKSMAVIREYAPLADKYGGYTVAFSGGKDSQVMLDLFKKSGVNYHAVYNVTTNDPPENVRYIRTNYPEVEFSHPKLTFLQLIEKKRMLPTKIARFCCANLKENSGKGYVAVGVRREESLKRSTYETIAFQSKTSKKFAPEKMTKSRKVIVRPILEWKEDEIWQYIDDNNLPINPCYDHSGRVGCLFCPFVQRRSLIYAKEHYPRYYQLFLKTIQNLLYAGYLNQYQPLTPEQVFEWWISKQSTKMFFSQTKLDI
jgi:phosphoadenosine phosphosulfate reductase